MFEFNQFINRLSANKIESITQISSVAIDTHAKDQDKLDNTTSQQQTGPQEKKSTENQTDKNLVLSPAEKKLLLQLKARDAEVRRHEQAHAQAAGPYLLQGPQFSYQKGPDNKLYAIGGHVALDISKGATPEETLKKAAVIKRAALAPAVPSSQDHNIARQADQLLQEARQQIQKEKRASQTFTAQGKLDTLSATSLFISVSV
ncbi:putative metalloprotease CJM1_0395 family protein [Piscirickettsia litoralis]|uniref:SrpA-related protein n=1 Tax=Piscirickettsia litoralis TaxID=1891921 RepID=A0ABX3A1D6_9GAMM|nr:putative metalloprotease CJM1_0395 family protein [Piscirickettsia litoralis]ODN42676.1 hypothetical protein BGC07_06775 [Piscirickettsia litoralis]